MTFRPTNSESKSLLLIDGANSENNIEVLCSGPNPLETAFFVGDRIQKADGESMIIEAA
jgi:hypothetical protein